MKNDNYIHALKYSWLTRFYDPVVALVARERRFRQKLLDGPDLAGDECVLDLACGTGTFAVMLKARYPGTTVTGLDGDPAILKLARKKSRDAGAEVTFDEGMSCAMPYGSAEFDIVFSSLFFHHLNTEYKLRTLQEVMRVLKPGGTFFLCDWGPPSYQLSKMTFIAVRVLDGFEVTRDNVKGRLPSLIEQSGFRDTRVTGHVETMLGTLDIMSARNPGA